ncbi:MAG TPA: GxxExxY protein [Methylomirabilota bacterium]|nr:GxxExxY protein [Methylomirabilota bacterium]
MEYPLQRQQRTPNPVGSTKGDPLTYAIIGCAMEVHRTLGCGFLEAVYQEALAHELSLRKIRFEREVTLQINYKAVTLASTYRADFVCEKTVIVELKAIAQLTNADEAQVLNQLKAAQLNKALLLNFGAANLEYRRFVSSRRVFEELDANPRF